MQINEEKIRKLDSQLVSASKKIKVLNALTWPADAEDKFLEGWRKGNPTLPEIKLAIPDVEASVAALSDIASQCDTGHPVEKFLAETASSYADAGRMLQNIGTTEFTHYSIRIYGRPDMVYKFQDITAVDGAKYLLEVTDRLMDNKHIETTEFNITAEDFAGWLRKMVDEFFAPGAVKVVIDQNMSSKALAGATRIRVRGSAVFSELDKDQLLFHEAYVHTATQLNGRQQPNLQSMGLGAPRTTRTQEGIAVLAELMANAMDINRLRRVALRVIAVKMALEGADFIELFKYFLVEGQSEIESVRSAQRIFRGGAVKDKVVFTKDAVYLQGLFEVHSFLRVAMRDNRPDLLRNLFAGRLTIADAVRLQPMFESGWLKPPVYVPSWAADLRRMAALMAYSALTSNINLEGVTLMRAIELEEEIKNVNSHLERPAASFKQKP
jgi:uncharacterized protein (TIGR02421 family)